MNSVPTTPTWALLGRSTWMVFGPFALALLTFAIVSNGGGWVTGFNVAFFLALGAMLLGRWLEFRGGNPQTVDGAPANPDHLHRYLLLWYPN